MQLALQQVWPFSDTFLTAKKAAGQLMQAWIGHIQGLAFHMEQSGVEVSD